MGRGGGMPGSFKRAVAGTTVATANPQLPLSSCLSNNSNASRTHGPKFLSWSGNLTISSSVSSLTPSVSADSSAPIGSTFGSVPTGCDEFDWISVDGHEEEDDAVVYIDRAPSSDEIQEAVSALQGVCCTPSCSQLVEDQLEYDSDDDSAEESLNPGRVIQSVSRVGSDLDWREPPLHLCAPRISPPYQLDHIYDAFHLLHTEPTVQRVVIALSSDKAVWEAVMNNKVVREIRGSYRAAESISKSSRGTSEDSNSAVGFIRWVLESTKAKVMELADKVTKLVAELFKASEDEKLMDPIITIPLDPRLQLSVLLTVLVLLVVVVTRASRV